MSLSAKTIKEMAKTTAEIVRDGTESPMWAWTRLQALYEAHGYETRDFESPGCKYLWACMQKLRETYPGMGAAA